MHGWRGEGWGRPWLWAARWPLHFLVCTNDFYFCFLMQCTSPGREHPCHATANVLTMGCRLTGLSQAGCSSEGLVFQCAAWRGAWECSALAAALSDMVTFPQNCCLSFSDGRQCKFCQERPLPMFRWAQQGHRQILGSFLWGCQLYLALLSSALAPVFRISLLQVCSWNISFLPGNSLHKIT